MGGPADGRASSAQARLASWKSHAVLGEDAQNLVLEVQLEGKASSLAGAADEGAPATAAEGRESAASSRAPSPRAGASWPSGAEAAPSQPSTSHTAATSIDPSSISTSDEFLAWFSALKKEREDAREEQYAVHVARLQASEEGAAALLERVDCALARLASVESEYRGAVTKTNAIQGECQNLVATKEKLKAETAALESELRYFDSYDECSQELASATADSSSDKFIKVMGTIAESLTYLQEHENEDEAKVFARKFDQLFSRASALALEQFDRELVRAGSGAGNSLYESEFSAVGAKFLPLMRKIREDDCNERFYKLLERLCATYVKRRSSIVRAALRERVGGVSGADDVSAAARTAATHVVDVCMEESELFYRVFPRSGSTRSALGDLVSQACATLQDVLRPRVIAEERIGRLCDLVAALREETTLGDSDAYAIGEEARTAIQEAADNLCSDAQERLIFRAGTFVQAAVVAQRDRSSKILAHNDIPERDGIHPALTGALWLLERLHECMDKRVFGSLAQDTVVQCCSALHSAFSVAGVTARESAAQLLAHVVLLRDTLAALGTDITSTDKELDFSRTRDVFTSIVQRERLFASFESIASAIRDFVRLGRPEVAERAVSATSLLEATVTRVQDTLVDALANECAPEITEILQQVDDKAPRRGLPDSEKLHSAMQTLQQGLGERFSHAFESTVLQPGTATTVKRLVKDAILDMYTRLSTVITAELALAEREQITLLSLQRVSELLSGTH